jgi:hypothetical protein
MKDQPLLYILESEAYYAALGQILGYDAEHADLIRRTHPENYNFDANQDFLYVQGNQRELLHYLLNNIYFIASDNFFGAVAVSLGHNVAGNSATIIRGYVIEYLQENAQYILNHPSSAEIQMHEYRNSLGLLYQLSEIQDSIVIGATSQVLNRQIHIFAYRGEIENSAQGLFIWRTQSGDYRGISSDYIAQLRNLEVELHTEEDNDREAISHDVGESSSLLEDEQSYDSDETVIAGTSQDYNDTNIYNCVIDNEEFVFDFEQHSDNSDETVMAVTSQHYHNSSQQSASPLLGDNAQEHWDHLQGFSS